MKNSLFAFVAFLSFANQVHAQEGLKLRQIESETPRYSFTMRDAISSARLGFNIHNVRTAESRPEDQWEIERNPAHPNEDVVYTSKNNVWRFPVSVNEQFAHAILGTTVLVFTQEREALHFVQKNDGKIADRHSRTAEKFGTNKPFLAAGSTYVLALVIENDQLRDAMWVGMKVAIATALVNDTLKHTFNRALPKDTNDPFARATTSKTPSLGMPSGHASQAFAVATFISRSYGAENSMIPVLAYGAASLTAWSRVYDNQHWVSDVLVGALVGHTVANSVMDSSNPHVKKNHTITPYFRRNAAGLMVTFHEQVKDQNRPCGHGLTGEAKMAACIASAAKNN